MSTKKDSNLNTQKKIGLSEKELPAGRSCFRMTFLIYGFQFLIDKVGIQLCGGDVAMSHQVLKHFRIHAGLSHVTTISMTAYVR